MNNILAWPIAFCTGTSCLMSKLLEGLYVVLYMQGCHKFLISCNLCTYTCNNLQVSLEYNVQWWLTTPVTSTELSRDRCYGWQPLMTTLYVYMPYDWSLPALPISICKVQSRKKPAYLCAPREFLKNKQTKTKKTKCLNAIRASDFWGALFVTAKVSL